MENVTLALLNRVFKVNKLDYLACLVCLFAITAIARDLCQGIYVRTMQLSRNCKFAAELFIDNGDKPQMYVIKLLMAYVSS